MSPNSHSLHFFHSTNCIEQLNNGKIHASDKFWTVHVLNIMMNEPIHTQNCASNACVCFCSSAHSRETEKKKTENFALVFIWLQTIYKYSYDDAVMFHCSTMSSYPGSLFLFLPYALHCTNFQVNSIQFFHRQRRVQTYVIKFTFCFALLQLNSFAPLTCHTQREIDAEDKWMLSLIFTIDTKCDLYGGGRMNQFHFYFATFTKENILLIEQNQATKRNNQLKKCHALHKFQSSWYCIMWIWLNYDSKSFLVLRNVVKKNSLNSFLYTWNIISAQMVTFIFEVYGNGIESRKQLYHD